LLFRICNYFMCSLFISTTSMVLKIFESISIFLPFPAPQSRARMLFLFSTPQSKPRMLFLLFSTKAAIIN
jgi:hypothetical protein